MAESKSSKRRPSEYRSDTQVRRLMEVGLTLSLDPMLHTYAGTLCAQGHMTPRQLSTVDYVARVYGRFEFYHAPGRRRPKSPAYEAGLARSSGAGAHNEIAAASAKAEFEQLSAVLALFPKPHRGALEDLCVDNIHIPLNNYGTPGLPDVLVMLEMIDREVRGEPEPETETGRKLTRTRVERVESDEFVWRAGDVAGPGSSKSREANIVSMLDRLEKRREGVT